MMWSAAHNNRSRHFYYGSNMKRIISVSIILLAFSIVDVFAQGILSDGVLEGQGTVFYTYSYKSGPPDPNQTFDLYLKEHYILIQPSLGYFLSGQWELTLQPQLSFVAYNSNGTVYVSDSLGPRLVEGHNQQRSYSMQIFVGIFFHMPLSDRIVSFVGTSTGLSWHKSTWEYTREGVSPLSFDGAWSKATLCYPSLTTGLKIFPTVNWALTPQVQLIYKSYPSDPYYQFSYENEFSISFGVGFLVFLNHKNGG